MADGRKIPYIIEMIADDAQLRKQMKGMNWKDIMGSNADSFANLLGQEGKEAKERIESELMKLDLDWVKIFGMDKLEAALSRTFAKSRKQIDSALVDVDTKKIQTTIEFIESLGKAFDEMGAKFEAGSAARSLAPLLRTLEEIPDAVDRVMSAFDKLSSSGKLNFTPTINSKEIINETETIMSGVGKAVATQAHQVSKAVEQAYKTATSTIATLTSSRASAYNIKTQQELQKMLNGLKEEYSNFMQDASWAENTKQQQAAYAKAAKAAKDYLDLVKWADSSDAHGFVKGNFVTVSDSTMNEMRAAIDSQIEYSRQQIKRYEDEVQNVLQLNLADKLTENLKDLNLKISLPKESEFTKQINGYISRINKKRLEKIKTTIDVADELNPKSKKSREELDAQSVSAIERKFAVIDNAIDSQQQSILEKTREWRKNMQNAITEGGANSISFGFKWDSADVDAIASDIFENLQEFFAQEDHKIAIRIDEEALLNSIKGALGDKTIAIGGGGGNVSIDPASITSAIREGIRSAILGEPITANKTLKPTGEQSNSSKKDDEPSAPKHKIDVDKTYTTHLIDALQDIAKSATREDKNGNLNQKQKDVLNFFTGKGINLRDLGDTDDEVAKLLEQALFTTDEQGKIRGSDLVDAIEKFKSKSKVSWKSLDELSRVVRILLTSFGEEAEYEDSKLIDNQSNEIIKDASKKAKGVKGLRRIKNYYSKSNKQYNERSLPDEENINQIIELSEQMETDGLLAEQLEVLKKARQQLGDKTDDQSIAEFQTVYQEVWIKIEQRFYDLVNYLQTFSGKLDIQGRKTPVTFSNKTKESKNKTVNTLANLKDDVVIEHAEIYTSPNDQSIGLGIKSPKTGRASQGQERSLLKGSKTSFTVRQSHKDDLDVRYRIYNAIEEAIISDFKRGNVLQRLGLSTNRVGESDKTVEDYNKLIAEEEKNLQIAAETATLKEEFRQAVKKLLGDQVQYISPIDGKVVRMYSNELEEQRKKLIENQTEQKRLNQALADGAEWLDKVWPQEMEAAKQSGDADKQQSLLSRRDSVVANQTRIAEQQDILAAEEVVFKDNIQNIISLMSNDIQKQVSSVINNSLSSLQKLDAEHTEVEHGTPEEYAIVGKAQDLLKVLQAAEQDAIQRLKQFGISIDSLLTQEQQEFIKLAKKTFVTSQSNSKKDIRRDIVPGSSSGVMAISSNIDRLKNERDELIHQQEQAYLRQLIENSKLSGEVLERLQAESDARNQRYSALNQLDKVQSNLSLAYQKRSDASGRVNYAKEQKDKLDKFGLSVKGTYGNDVLNERKSAYANEFFASDWYYNEVKRIRDESSAEMKEVEDRIKQQNKEWKQVVDRAKQAAIQEVLSESSISIDNVRTQAESEFKSSKKYNAIRKRQEKKRDAQLAEIQIKIDNEVEEIVQSTMLQQEETIESEAKNIAKRRGSKMVSDNDYEKAYGRIEDKIRKGAVNKIEAKYAGDKALADSEMRVAIEDAISQAGERAVRKAIDDIIKDKDKHVKQRMYEAIRVRESEAKSDPNFQGITGDLATDFDKAQQEVYAKRKRDVKELSKSYYANLISEGGILSIPQSRNEDGTWVVTTEDVHAIVEARLKAMLEGANDDKASAQENIDKYAAIKSNIISENGLTEEEVYNRNLARAMLLEQERQVQYKENIELLNKVLEDEGLADEQKKLVKAKIRELETNLQDSQLTEEALQTRRETTWAQRKTNDTSNEEKIAKNEERIASYNESIEKSQNKQTQLRTQIAELAERARAATDEEKKSLEEQQATLQSRLEDEKKTEENLKKDRVRRKKENERLKETPVEIANSQKKDNSVVAIFANAIKEAVREAIGKGGIGDTSGIATENTLKEILAVLTGGKVVQDPDVDKKLARIAELEAKSKTTTDKNITTKNTKKKEDKKKEKKKKEETPDYIEQARKYEKETLSTITSQEELAKVAQNLVTNIEKAAQGSKKAVELQLKLQKVISASGKLYKNSTGEKRYTKDKIGELLGIGDKVGLKLTEADARKIAEQGFVSMGVQTDSGDKLNEAKDKANTKEREAKAEEKITKEKQKQKVITSGLSKAERDELTRLKEEVKPGVVSANETTAEGIGFLAREDTLSKILEVLNAFKSEGVKTTGKAKGEVDEKTPKKTEAELIKERALKDKDAVLGIASSSKIKKKYEQLIKQLESESDLSKIKALAQKTSALGFNIKKESFEWDYKTADANRVYNIPNANTFGKRPETVRKSMEKLAQTKFNPDSKQYEFLNFDGTKLVYQLTDIKGNVEKVTMEWSELNNQVAITSDKSVAKLDGLANKVETFEGKFKNAIVSGYLGEKDQDLKKFQNAVAKINDEISNGASFETIEKFRNEALRIADQVDKKVTKNKRLYSGTTEINAVTRQRDNMEARGILDKTDIVMVEQYNKIYDNLIKKHNRFKANGTLFNPKNQKTLQNMAIQAKDLGKQLEKSVTEAEQLKQLVDNSGIYQGKQMGGVKQLAPEEASNLETSMKSYLKTLGFANAEHVKYDHIHQKLTATQRVSSRAVADLEMKYNEATGALYAYQKQERESLTGLPAFLNGFQKKFNSIMQYLTMTMSIHQVMTQLRRGVQYIKEIDLALTELRKVTDETEETYDRFLQTAAKTGERLGSTISAVTEATATFAKLGYSMQQATEMAEAAIVYKNVGDNIASTEDAADSIISTMKGFGLEATESMAIVDKFNEVGE